MLAIGVDDEDKLTGGCSDTALDRGTISFVVGVTNDPCARGLTLWTGVILRAVVDNQDLVPCCRMFETFYHRGDTRRLVVGRDHDGRSGRVRHAGYPCATGPCSVGGAVPSVSCPRPMGAVASLAALCGLPRSSIERTR